MNFMQYALDYTQKQLNKLQKNNDFSSFSFENLPRTRNAPQKLPSLHYSASNLHQNSNSLSDPKLSEIFDTYVESKYLSQQKYLIDFDEFLRLPFRHRFPEIYFDLIFYVARFKVAEKAEENLLYYGQLEKLATFENLEGKGGQGGHNGYKIEWLDDISYLRIQIDNLIKNKEVKL